MRLKIFLPSSLLFLFLLLFHNRDFLSRGVPDICIFSFERSNSDEYIYMYGIFDIDRLIDISDRFDPPSLEDILIYITV